MVVAVLAMVVVLLVAVGRGLFKFALVGGLQEMVAPPT